MADYPGAEGERRVSEPALTGVVTEIFGACGMTPEHAFLLADSLVKADLRGIHSHGVLRVPDYVKKLTEEGVDPRGAPRVVRDAGGALLVDGGNAMGQIAGTFAMAAAIDRARTANVALAAVRGSNHCGAMEHYVRMALAEDMIGIATTNALPTMAPWGGVEKIVGLNPLAVAIPAKAERPLVLDIALGATAHGKIRVYAQKGEPLPEGWAFDRHGRPTTDAAAALDGLIQPIGAFKGIGLAIVTGILSTVLSGAAYGTELGNMVDGPTAGADGHLFMAVNIAAFEDVDRFKSRIDAIVHQLHGCHRADGVERIYAPGEPEADLAARYAADGIPLNDETLAGILTAANRVGVDARELM